MDKVYSKDGKSVKYVGSPRYNGAYLKPSSLEFSAINVPFVIDWEVGDYIDYSYNGQRYYLYSLPQPTKQARVGKAGDSITYSAVQFFAKSKDFEIVPFKDFVIADNKRHFTTRSGVSTYEDLYGIKDRIQACLDEMLPGEWTVRVYDKLSDEQKEEALKTKAFSVDGSLLAALDQVYELWGFGWSHIVEDGKDVLVIGMANVKNEDTIVNTEFIYGKGNALKSLRKSVSNADEIATKLYVYGSNRNMLPRYYNDKEIMDSEGVDIQNLMIPLDKWGQTDGLPDASKAFLIDEAAVAKLGLIPKVVYFDGSDNPEIYPSLEGVTIGDLRGVMNPREDYYPADVWEDSERVDEVYACEMPDDDATEGDDVIPIEMLSILDNHIDIAFSVEGEPNSRRRTLYGAVILEGGNTFGCSTTTSFKVLQKTESVGVGIENIKAFLIVNDNRIPMTVRHTSDFEWDLQADGWAVDKSDKNYVECDVEITITPRISSNFLVYVRHDETTQELFTYNRIANAVLVTTRELGFNLNKMATLGGDGRCTIAMRSGMCAGREFPVGAVAYNHEDDTWELAVKKVIDEDLGISFPNKTYPIAKEDKFVLLDIAMPEIYVRLAEQRLYREGMKLLDEIKSIKPLYEPELNAIAIKEKGLVLREGMYLKLTDEDILDGSDYGLIDTITIDHAEAAIPTFRITLRETKRRSFQQEMQGKVSSLSKAVDAKTDATASSVSRVAKTLTDLFGWNEKNIWVKGSRNLYTEQGAISAGGKNTESGGGGGGVTPRVFTIPAGITEWTSEGKDALNGKFDTQNVVTALYDSLNRQVLADTRLMASGAKFIIKLSFSEATKTNLRLVVIG